MTAVDYSKFDEIKAPDTSQEIAESDYKKLEVSFRAEAVLR